MSNQTIYVPLPIGEINDGGPAFPSNFNPGMTLRQYYAAKAMAAYITSLGVPQYLEANGGLVKESLRTADAMIAAEAWLRQLPQTDRTNPRSG